MKKDYLIPIIILLGILLRIFVYSSGIPFWGDEAALAINVMNKSYFELFKGLDYLQVAPPMFLVLSKFVMLDSLRDFSLRLIPLISGIISVPLFYKFITMYSNSKKVIYVSTFLFSFNTTAILFCVQFKQYSFELLIALILLIIFYKIIFQEEFKWYYPIVIALSPWFSLSSLFIIGSYFFLILAKNPKLIFKTYVPFFISFLAFYFISLKFMMHTNYGEMSSWWQSANGFIDLKHPSSILTCIGGLFSFYNKFEVFYGSIIFISLIKFNKKKNFLYLPILLTFITSSLKLYPVSARLILFLLPFFVCLVAEYDWKFSKMYFTVVCTMSFIMAVYNTINLSNIFPPIMIPKGAINVISTQLKNNEKIVFDHYFYSYYYYLEDRSNIILLKNGLALNNHIKEIENLPSGRYYLITGDNIKNKLTKNVKILNVYKSSSIALYVEKQ